MSQARYSALLLPEKTSEKKANFVISKRNDALQENE